MTGIHTELFIYFVIMSSCLGYGIRLVLTQLEKTKNEIIRMNAAEAKAQLQKITDAIGAVGSALSAATDQLGKALGEINTEIADLKNQIANGDLPTDLSDAINSTLDKVTNLGPIAQQLSSVAQQLDDLNPDASTTSSTTPAPENP